MRPKATTKSGQRLSPHKEGNEDDSGNDTGSSFGANGKSRLFGNPSAASEASGHHEDDSDEEENASMASHEEVGSETGILVDEENGDRSSIELNDVLESLGDALYCSMDESESSNVRYIGVMEDRVDFANARPKTKRVLSYNTLFALNADADHNDDDSKRARSNLNGLAASRTATFSLGPPALQESKHTGPLQVIRDESPVISSSDDEELDRQLGEELGHHEEADGSRDNTPVPLLTPPGSPLTIEVDGNTTTVCEWPSNLAVDSAMQAVHELRPLSPASLEHFERDEEDRVPTRQGPAKGSSEATTLTPMLRSIYVGMH